MGTEDRADLVQVHLPAVQAGGQPVREPTGEVGGADGTGLGYAAST
jgi:hypothetical protein